MRRGRWQCALLPHAALCSALSRSSALWSDPSRSARRSFRYRPRTRRTRQPRSRPRRCCAHLRRAPPDRSRSAHPDTPFPRITAPAVSDRAAVAIPRPGNRLPLSCCGSDYWSSGLFLRRRNDRQPHRAGTREHSPSVTPSSRRGRSMPGSASMRFCRSGLGGGCPGRQPGRRRFRGVAYRGRRRVRVPRGVLHKLGRGRADPRPRRGVSCLDHGAKAIARRPALPHIGERELPSSVRCPRLRKSLNCSTQ